MRESIVVFGKNFSENGGKWSAVGNSGRFHPSCRCKSKKVGNPVGRKISKDGEPCEGSAVTSENSITPEGKKQKGETSRKKKNLALL